MRTEIEAIILQAVRFSDTAYMIHVYSDLFGSLSLRASRPAGPSKRRTTGGTRALFIPLSVVRTTIDYRASREVFIPSGTTIVRLLSSPGTDPSANALALFATELLHRLLRSGLPDRDLYRYITESLESLDRLTPQERASWHLQLMTGLCHHLGILPQYESYRAGQVLDCGEGLFRPVRTRSEVAETGPAELLYRFITSPDPLHIPLSREERGRLMSLLLDYMAYHFPEMGTMRSPDILRQLS